MRGERLWQGIKKFVNDLLDTPLPGADTGQLDRAMDRLQDPGIGIPGPTVPPLISRPLDREEQQRS